MKTRTIVWLGVAAVGIAGGGFLGGRALAAGIPTGADAMRYSGMLETSSGAPMTGAHDIVFSLWDSGQTAAGSPRCNVQNPSGGYDLGTTGRFTIELPDACTTAVKTYPNLWVELTVDSTVLPRTKLGAVPYAVEADRARTAVSATTATNATNAVNATTANTAGGALDTRVRAIEDRIATLEGRAVLTLVDKVWVGSSSVYYAECSTQSGILVQGVCARMADAACIAAGYRSGWFEGNFTSNQWSARCVR